MDDGTVDMVIDWEGANHPDLHITDRSNIPVDIKFNTCLRQFGITVQNYDDYQLVIDEGSNGLGLSRFRKALFYDPAVAHPSIADAVMNYNRVVGNSEADCEPYPMDLLALHALYQSELP